MIRSEQVHLSIIKCRCDHQTVRVNTTHLNFYLASSVSATRHNSATLVLRNVGVYILARYKNFPTPLWKFFPVFAWTFPLFPLFMKSSMKFFPVFQISPIFPPPWGVANGQYIYPCRNPVGFIVARSHCQSGCCAINDPSVYAGMEL